MATAAGSPLIRDEPYWIALEGGRRSGIWRLRLYRDTDTHLTAVVTEPTDADGPSITNCAEEVLNDLSARFPGEQVRLIEHYPQGIGLDEEHFDLVSLSDGSVDWKRIPSTEMVRQYGSDILLTNSAEDDSP